MRLCTAKHIVQRQKLSIKARVEVLLKKDNCSSTSPIFLILEIKVDYVSFTGSFFISLILAGGAYPFGDLALFFFFLFEVFVVAVALLADVEGNVAVLDHVADLALHGDRKEDAKVDQEDGPEDWDVKHSEQGAEERNHYRACCRVPNISRIKIKD